MFNALLYVCLSQTGDVQTASLSTVCLMYCCVFVCHRQGTYRRLVLWRGRSWHSLSNARRSRPGSKGKHTYLIPIPYINLVPYNVDTGICWMSGKCGMKGLPMSLSVCLSVYLFLCIIYTLVSTCGNSTACCLLAPPSFI